MTFRTGKYQGYSIQEVSFIDPGYLRWVRENRPEMLRERRAEPKAQKIEVSEEELEQKKAYKNIPLGSWNSSF